MSIEIPIIMLSSPSGRRLLERIRSAAVVRSAQARERVEEILSAVRHKGDRALFDYTEQFDMVRLSKKNIRLDPEYVRVKARKAPPAFRRSCADAARRIRAFHQRQKAASFTITTREGKLSQLVKPLGRVGVYVPGGYTMYPSTVLMNVIPAQIAGVGQIAVATPPRGELNPAIAFALDLLGMTEVYRMGGAQAIAAFAYGTQSVKRVDKIVGPGNLYVALAKKAVYGTVDIDSIAGPSEVIVLADGSANPEWVALDLLAQAEHGSGDETALCVTEDPGFAKKVRQAVDAEIRQSPVRDVFNKLRLDALCICVADSRRQSIDFVNECAPEHLEIMTRTYKRDLAKIANAGAVFLGPYSPVAMGDYFVGTNHVLPTGGAARFSSPLGVESFVKRMSVAEISKRGLKQSAARVSVLARMEKFVHHALSVERRVVAIIAVSLSLASILASCSAVAVGLNQDARPLEPGQYQIGGGFGSGLDYTAEVTGFLDTLNGDTSKADAFFGTERGLLTHMYIGGKMRIGVFPHGDLTQMVWIPLKITGWAVGGRTGMTLGFAPQSSAFQCAVVPAFMYMFSQGDTALDPAGGDFNIYGAELPLVVSYDVGKVITPFVAFGYAYNSVVLNKTRVWRDTSYTDLPKINPCQRFSIQVGAVARIKHFSISPELGYHLVQEQHFGYRSLLSLGVMFGYMFGESRQAPTPRQLRQPVE